MAVLTESTLYRFGPFELDASRRRLAKGGALVPLPDRQMDVLLILVANAGRIVSKEDIAEVAWRGIAVSDNSIDKAISALRQTLGVQQDGAPYIETQKRKGVRHVARVTRDKPLRPAVSVDALLEPYHAFVDGRAALETLDRGAIERARHAFAEALRLDPDLAVAHVGMANAYLLNFEMTRADIAPDRAALVQAEHHAREACRLDAASGDAWSTLAVAWHRVGLWRDAIAAARKAIHLEPREWRHHLRHAFVSWGGERLDATERVLNLCPDLAFAYWLAATVFIARLAFTPAREQLRAGCALQDTQAGGAGRFKSVGLHLQHGLVLAAQGEWRLAEQEARQELSRELALEDPGHVYGRESAANAWHTIGAMALRKGHRDEAAAAFREALARVPGHPMTVIGYTHLLEVAPDATRSEAPSLVALDPFHAVLVGAAMQALRGEHVVAAEMYAGALLKAEWGGAGWQLPVDPLLQALAHRDVWRQPLAIISSRAS